MVFARWQKRCLLAPKLFPFLTFLHGPVAQLIERIVRNDEVVGLIPIWSTSLRQGFGWQASFLSLAKRARATRVEGSERREPKGEEAPAATPVGVPPPSAGTSNLGRKMGSKWDDGGAGGGGDDDEDLVPPGCE